MRPCVENRVTLLKSGARSSRYAGDVPSFRWTSGWLCKSRIHRATFCRRRGPTTSSSSWPIWVAPTMYGPLSACENVSLGRVARTCRSLPITLVRTSAMVMAVTAGSKHISWKLGGSMLRAHTSSSRKYGNRPMASAIGADDIGRSVSNTTRFTLSSDLEAAARTPSTIWSYVSRAGAPCTCDEFFSYQVPQVAP